MVPLAAFAASAIAAPANDAPPYAATTIHTFGTTASSGQGPWGNLTLGRDGNLYGTTFEGGVNNTGTIFRMKPNGATETLHSFAAAAADKTNADGSGPTGNLVQGADGSFYGAAPDGGTNGTGTLFKISTAGVFTVLHTFSPASSSTSWVNTDGAYPGSPLLLASDGSIYGTAVDGGKYGSGVAFKMATDGTIAVLHDFGGPLSGGGTDIATPQNGLLMGRDGNYYGVTAGFAQGSDIMGSIYQLAPAGKLTVVHTFYGSSTDYNYPGPLAIGNDGNFYGATYTGTIFQMTPSGTFTVLHDGNDQGPYTGNDNNIDGLDIGSVLTLGSDGNFYGTTGSGGEFSGGEIFRITPTGDFTVLYYFDSAAGGGFDTSAGVTFGADGNLYGTTDLGGAKQFGTAFKLPMPVPAGWGTGPAITIDASISPTTISLSKGQSATLTWSAVNAAQCHVNGQNVVQNQTVGTSGTMTIVPKRRGVYYYQVDCDNAGKAADVSVSPLTVTK
jgi:uncharacterized repeat protein (TIGR03803 family)